MAFKRVPLYYGDTVQLCFVPKHKPQTLSCFDDIAHDKTRKYIFIHSNVNGLPICLDHQFLTDYTPYGPHQIGLAAGGKVVGGFRFEKSNGTDGSHNVSTEDLRSLENALNSLTERLSNSCKGLEADINRVSRLLSRIKNS